MHVHAHAHVSNERHARVHVYAHDDAAANDDDDDVGYVQSAHEKITNYRPDTCQESTAIVSNTCDDGDGDYDDYDDDDDDFCCSSPSCLRHQDRADRPGQESRKQQRGSVGERRNTRERPSDAKKTKRCGACAAA